MKQVILEIRSKKVGGPLRFWGGKRRGPTATNIAESPSNLRGYALNIMLSVEPPTCGSGENNHGNHPTNKAGRAQQGWSCAQGRSNMDATDNLDCSGHAGLGAVGDMGVYNGLGAVGGMRA